LNFIVNRSILGCETRRTFSGTYVFVAHANAFQVPDGVNKEPAILHRSTDAPPQLNAASQRRESVAGAMLTWPGSRPRARVSEHPAAVIPLAMGWWMMLQRNLLYISVTRASLIAGGVREEQHELPSSSGTDKAGHPMNMGALGSSALDSSASELGMKHSGAAEILPDRTRVAGYGETA
jgi:hypothetical protein